MMDSKSNLLKGKSVVITGGAGLLGRKFCVAVAKQGGLAIVADLNHEAANKLAAEIVADGGLADACELDIRSADSVDRMINYLHTQYGGVRAVVNNAYPKSKNYGCKFEDVKYTDLCDSLSIHLGGYFLVAQKFAEYFKAHGGGNIVNMSSIYGSIPPRFQIYDSTTMTMPVEYALVKAGVNQLTRYIAQYYKGAAIRCNTLSPGGIVERQPAEFLRNYDAYCAGKGMLEPQDICGTLLFLLSDNSTYVNGQNLIVDDGFSL